MLYRDYSRPAGEQIPNIYGGRENLEAVHFLRRMNEVLGQECPGGRDLRRRIHGLAFGQPAAIDGRPRLPLQVEYGY